MNNNGNEADSEDNEDVDDNTAPGMVYIYLHFCSHQLTNLQDIEPNLKSHNATTTNNNGNEADSEDNEDVDGNTAPDMVYIFSHFYSHQLTNPQGIVKLKPDLTSCATNQDNHNTHDVMAVQVCSFPLPLKLQFFRIHFFGRECLTTWTGGTISLLVLLPTHQCHG
jgi:hypothetical protein